MQNEGLSELLKRFLGTRRYMWDLIAVAILLALSINLLASAIYAKIGGWPSLALGVLLGIGCLGYLIYARMRENVFSTIIRGFFVIKRDSSVPVYVPGYDLASRFESIASAVFAENPALERQWKAESAQRFGPGGFKLVDLRVATEIAEYILLDNLSMHLSGYFNTPALEESQLETIERNDIPEVLLSNRILELVSRELRDRPWYKPEDDSDSTENVVAYYGPGMHYSHFDLTMPKGSSVRRVGPGSLVISSKMITLELTATVGDGYRTMEGIFPKYYLDLENLEALRVEVTYRVRAILRRRLGVRILSWRYYSWIESFIEEATKNLDAKNFFQRISWDSTEVLLRIILAKYPPRKSRISEMDDAKETNEPETGNGENT